MLERLCQSVPRKGPLLFVLFKLLLGVSFYEFNIEKYQKLNRTVQKKIYTNVHASLAVQMDAHAQNIPARRKRNPIYWFSIAIPH